MAHGWDSYFDNIPPLSSNPRTLRKASESEGHLSQNIENFIEHNEFSNTEPSHENLATDSNFNTNYYSNPSIGNSSSDCVYQQYYRETPWQADGEQMEKDYLPGCGNSDISDFATDGISSSEPFPSSFATDLQGIKQECGMLTSSFLESYSDVSSCSDADVSETRPSCKFMKSNPVSKRKTDVTTKQSSSEWLFTPTGNMTVPTEANVILPSSSNVKAKERIVECAQDKVKSPAKTVKSYIKNNQSSTISNMVPNTESETAEARNDYQDQEQQEDLEREQTQEKHSQSSISDQENLTGDGIVEFSDDKERQTTATAATTLDIEEDHLEGKVLRKKIKESLKQENEGFDHPTSADLKDQDKSEGLKGVNETLGQKAPKPISIGGQDENMEMGCQEKEIQSNSHPSSDPCDIKVSASIAATCELRECTSMMECNSQDGGSCLQLSGHQSKNEGQNNICSSPTVINNGNFNDANDNKKSVACHSESCVHPNSPNTDANSCIEKECVSATERTNTTSSLNTDSSTPGVTSDHRSVDTKNQKNCSSEDTNPSKEKKSAAWKKSTPSIDPDCRDSTMTSNIHSIISNDSNKQHVANQLDSCLQLDCSSIDTNPRQEKELTSPAKKTHRNTSPPDQSDPSATGLTNPNLNEQSVATPLESNSQPGSSSKEITLGLGKDWTNLTDKGNTTSSTDSECSLSNALESCLQPNTLTRDDFCLEKENTDTTSSPCPQPSLDESSVALSGYVAENTRESFEEFDSSKEEHWEVGVLYGEPLSREDSSCDSDEAKLDPSQCEETSVARPKNNSTNHSGQASPLKSSTEMRKLLQPVVILKITESKNLTSNLYHCANCHHVAIDIDHLIEHYHCCHLVHNFQFCKTCRLYLMSKEEAEKHVCGVPKGPQLSSETSLKKKRKRLGRHKCMKCGLIFSKLVHYIKHMRTHTGKTPYRCNECGTYFAQNGSLHRHTRIPGRCKHSKRKSTEENSKTVTSETKISPKKEMLQETPLNLPECYVKLVDISKAHLCNFCGKGFTTTYKAKKHYYNVHKGKSLAVSLSQCDIIFSGEKSKNVEEETSKHRCPLCPRLFKYSYNRARHLRDCVRDAISGGKGKIGGKYRCPLCKVTFTLPSNRFRHIKTFCLKECLNRLLKEKAKSKQKVEQKQSKGTEPQKQSKDNEQRRQSKENDQKRQEPLMITAPKIPRYRCSICPAVFCHASGKYRHMKKHEMFKLTGKMFRYRNSIFSTMSKLTTLSSTKTEQSEDNLKSTEAKTDLPLSCHFCGKCFSTSYSLKKHERNHKGEKPYRCLECGKGFKKRAYLIGHKIVHQRRIQCTVCRKILPNIGELIQHRTTHDKRGMLQCPDCPVQFQYPAHLLRHLVSHKNREKKALHLEEAPPLKSQQSLESVNEQSGPKKLQCSLCEEVFSDAHLLRKHCLAHISGSSSRQCPFCKEHFTSRRYLLRHMIKHTGDKSFSCTYCGKQFYRDLYLKLHHEKCLPRKVTHLVTSESGTEKRRIYNCSYCPRTFSKKDRVVGHHRGHNSNTLLLCTRCKQYYGYGKLTQHQRNCVGPREVNSVSSSPSEDFSKSTPEKSQNVHKMPLKSNATKILQHKCPHCTQRFRYRSLLLRHLVSHTGVQPYACMHCGHRFSSRTMCLQHEAFCDGDYKEVQPKVKSDAAKKLSNMPNIRDAAQKSQAEGEAEYKCRFCTKTFMKPRNLRRHILTHNEAKPYCCKFCDSGFTRYDYLKVHQTHCKGKRSRLEVCIPKISLDDVGKGWQNRFSSEPVHQQETFQCDVCSRRFSTRSKLSRHVTMFHTVKLFKCKRCGSSFSHEKSLKKHCKMRKCRKVSMETDSSLPAETNPPQENVTNPLHEVRSRVLQRIQSGFNKKHKYVCSFCPRTFGNSWQLHVHIRLHTGEKPYSCDYCGQRFIRKDYVKRHYVKCIMKQEQRKVLCDRCGGFFSKVELENHKISCSSKPNVSTVSQQKTPQSQTKGFSCAYCSSRFLLFSQLQEHFLNAHKLETVAPPASTAPLQHHLSNIPSLKDIKEEPLDESFDEPLCDGANLICELDKTLNSDVSKLFVCPECNMSFASKAGLIGHLRVHKMEHPFSCKTCKKGFWNKSLLRNHNRKCRFGHFSAGDNPQQLEVPLKAEIDLALTDSVLVFSEGSKTTGTGVLQTNFSCKDDIVDESSQNSEENQVQSSSSREKYQCSECDMSFTDGLMLISHLEDHGRKDQEKKRNTCSKCGRVCSSQGHLEKHMKIHGINKKYSCPHCPKMLYTITDLEVHKSCHDPNRPYSCKLCNHRFWTRPSLCNHYSEDHPNDVFTCRFCNKAYSVKKSLVRHYKKWHQKEQKDLKSTGQEKGSTEQQSSSQVSTTGESDEDENNRTDDSDSDSAPYFPCHVCGKTFTTSESLEDHQRCHLGEKPHECAECGKCFFQASQLQQHQRMHKSEFQCQACGRGFVSLFALRKHKHTHGKNRPYRCSKCQLSFTGPAPLSEHMSTHRDENFPCDICNRMFLSKSSRAEHRKSHSVSRDRPPSLVSSKEHEESASLFESSSVFTKELKYRCGICNERFKDPEELSEHGCIAAKERLYSCSDCHKHFLHASHLKKHMTTHLLSCSTSEYPCNQCNNSFSSAEQFLCHLKSHEGVGTAEVKGKDRGPSQVFICPVCHRCFPSATDLIDHFPTHPDNTFKCKTCKRTFTSGIQLEEHERCHLTSGTEFECAVCSQRFLGSDAFHQHPCTRQQDGKVKPSVKASPSTSQATGEEEEIDVTGEDVYNCPVCSMQFSSKSGLLEHQNKQHGPQANQFKCEMCGKTFALRRYLKEHERRHRQKMAAQKEAELTENKFNCIQCRSTFGTAKELSLHMRMHAEKDVGEHRCDMCYKSFSQWSLLKQHQESHVGQVVYECTECDKAFAFPHLLEEHQLTHAGSSQ